MEMSIKKAPLKTDPSSKCSRWRIIIFNPANQKREWYTVNGTRRDAEVFERNKKSKLASNIHIAKKDRRTFSQVVTSFLEEREERARRRSTIASYKTVIDCHLMSTFGPREVGAIRRPDIADHFTAMRKEGATVQTVNKALRAMKAILFYALEAELVERNVLQRFRPFEGGKQHVKRDAFTETEVRALLGAAHPVEMALIGLLCFAGLRPGELYALEWQNLDLEIGCARIVRSWDSQGKVFNPPKTKAGIRVVPLSAWLITQLKAHRDRSDTTGLVFPTKLKRPMNPANVRRDIWVPLKKRAGVRDLDLYSLRHTFASLGRTSGESAFNVARMMGHSRSSLVDLVYAHSMESGMSGVAESVTARALGIKPQLRVIEGGQRDVRETLDDTAQESAKAALTR
jgi:integrase